MSEHEVEPRMYTTVLREMIRHENDVTNHRIMWLLIGQGLIANAYVGVSGENPGVGASLAAVGVLLTISAHIILYKSYHARGYLEYLGIAAKAGTLKESQLPILGWPKTRVKGWRKGFWASPWLGRRGDLLEPYLFLPTLLVLAWMIVLTRKWLPVHDTVLVPLCGFLTPLLLACLSVGWVRMAQREESEPVSPPDP